MIARRPLLTLFLGFLLIGVAVYYWTSIKQNTSVDIAGYAVGAMQGFQKSPNRESAPDLPFKNASGESLTLRDYEGQVLLVNFWATWCAPCVYELPALDRLQAALGGEEFRVLAISLDLKGQEVAGPYLEKLSIDRLQPLTDPTNVLARSVGAIGLPTTILYDRNSREIGRLSGPAEWDEEEALALLQQAIKQTR